MFLTYWAPIDLERGPLAALNPRALILHLWNFQWGLYEVRPRLSGLSDILWLGRTGHRSVNLGGRSL